MLNRIRLHFEENVHTMYLLAMSVEKSVLHIRETFFSFPGLNGVSPHVSLGARKYGLHLTHECDAVNTYDLKIDCFVQKNSLA